MCIAQKPYTFISYQPVKYSGSHDSTTREAIFVGIGIDCFQDLAAASEYGLPADRGLAPTA